jgi:hypothetical protein
MNQIYLLKFTYGIDFFDYSVNNNPPHNIGDFRSFNHCIITMISETITTGLTHYYNNGIWMNKNQYNFNIEISIDKSDKERVYQTIKNIICENIKKDMNGLINQIQVFGHDIDTYHFCVNT